MSEQIDIHPHVDAICTLLGLRSDCVGWMKITPTRVEVLVYKTNAEGKKYVENGQVAREVKRFAVWA